MQRRIAYPQVGNPNDLLVAKQKLILNIDTEATIIHQNWSEHLKPEDPGLYLRGSTKPLIRPGVQYTDRNGLMVITLENLDSFHEPLYYASGKVAASAFVMGDKKKYLVPRCTVPATAYQLICALVEQLIGSINPWPNNQARGDRAYSLIKAGAEELLTEEQFVPIVLTKLFEDILAFIDEDVWNYYNVTLVGTGLVIEKMVDYRVYEWTRMIYEQQNPDHE